MLSVDFIVELPLSSRHDAVMIVVDSVLKRVHFILIHTMVIVEGATRLFLHQVWKLHSVMLDSHLGNKSDIFHYNHENNQLEKRVRPPRDVS